MNAVERAAVALTWRQLVGTPLAHSDGLLDVDVSEPVGEPEPPAAGRPALRRLYVRAVLLLAVAAACAGWALAHWN